ncbi:hypothetical protein BC834DRAFT_327603 [Gloeopeniophorella convolvens]|nr:hypothetical protein BC834DRAFT_327603 [Gloeopeniophorella convolvens]
MILVCAFQYFPRSHSHLPDCVGRPHPRTAMDTRLQSLQSDDRVLPAVPPDPATSSSLPAILDSTLKQYAAKTGTDLTTHRLAAKLGRCDSIDAVLGVFQDQLYVLKAYQSRRGRRARVLEAAKPLVNAALALSESGVLDKALGSVFPPAQAILGAIGFLLQTAKKVGESYDALVGLFDSIGGFLARLGIYERAPLPVPIAEVVVKVVAEMLSIFALATKEIEQGRLKKFGKTLLGDKRIEDALKRMDTLTQEEQRTVAAQTYSNTAAIKGDVRQVLSNQDSVKQADLQGRYRKWLDPPDPSTNHILACKGHHTGTSVWFTGGRIFGGWRKAGSLLWIHGKPGSGKSVLCSTLIQELERLHSDEPDIIISYFYFDFRDSKKQDFRGMLTSLIIQLSAASDSLCASVSQLYLAHGNGLKQPGDDALMQCLMDMLAVSGRGATYVIVDALDECPNNRSSPPRHEILGFLDMLASVRSSDLRVCVTSRPEEDIIAALQPMASHRICLEDESGHALDMECFIRYTVENNPKMRRWKEKTRELVIETLSENADGMFRYVACQLDILCNCPPAAVEATLHTLPKTLYATYESTLRRIDDDSEDNWRHAHRIFQCLAFSTRPLRVEEIAEVLAVDFDRIVPSLNPDWRSESLEDAILSTCPGSFVVIVESHGRRVVQFAHFSVKEFLTSDRLANSPNYDASRFHILPERAHEVLARTCLATLLQLDASVDEHSLRNYSLSCYAAKYWGDHARVDGVLRRLIDAAELLFDTERPHFAAWIWVNDHSHWSLHDTNHPSETSPTPLYCAAKLGLAYLVDRLAASHPESVEMTSNGHGTPLQAAAKGNYLSIVQALLKYGADVNAESGAFGTALQAASSRGHLEITRLLLEHGTDVNAAGGDSENALQSASREGHLEITQLLLEHGADTDARDDDGGTALQAALRAGHLEIARLLLEYRADVDSRDDND